MGKAGLIWLLASIGGILGAIFSAIIGLNCTGAGCEMDLVWAIPLGIFIGAVSLVIIGVLINSLIK